MYKYFKPIKIDDWKASLISKEIVSGWTNPEYKIIGMLRFFPDWKETAYKSPEGDYISLTLKFESYKDLVVNKFKYLEEGDQFYVNGNIDSNYVPTEGKPHFEGETKHGVRIDSIYSDDNKIFRDISEVAVLITA